MTSRLRGQEGFTLVELLLVCSISVVLFGATLTAWTALYGSHRALENQHDNAEAARVAIDRAARQLRNLANPTVSATTTIDRAGDYDFIFQTSDPARTWVRYCLESGGGEGAKLWENESAGAVSPAMRGPCPGSGWSTQRAVVEDVSNEVNGLDRNVFTYECSVSSPLACPASATDYKKITSVGIELWVDADRNDRVSELNVTTGVFLRNQNEAPTAVVSAALRTGPLRWFLNGSGSSDPEGRTLQYFWFEGAPPSATEIANTPCTQSFPNTVERGVTFSKNFDPSDAGGQATFYLLVRDPGCLTHLSGPITIGPIS